MRIPAPSTSSLDHSQGFHFILTTHLHQSPPDDCSAHVSYSLPPDVYIDPYELETIGIDFKLNEYLDLELPVEVAGMSGAELRVDIQPGVRNVSVPLHARYGRLSTLPTTGHRVVHLPGPHATWTCPDHVGHGHVEYSDHTGLDIRVPVGFHDDITQVELFTALLVASAAFYLLLAYCRAFKRMQKASPARV